MTEPLDDSNEPNFVIVVGGDHARRVRLPPTFGASCVVIAADSGLDIALAAGLAVHHVVGDLDSVDSEALDAAVDAGASVHRYPADKDATDFELALDLVLDLASGQQGPNHLLVVGPGGGRQDMAFADLLALAGASLHDVDVTARYGDADWLVVRPGRTRRFVGTPQEQVSLLPAHGSAHGVTTAGLRWPLANAELRAGATRGISNTVIDGAVSVAITAGVLLVCRPGFVASPVPPRATPHEVSLAAGSASTISVIKLGEGANDGGPTMDRLTAKYRS